MRGRREEGGGERRAFCCAHILSDDMLGTDHSAGKPRSHATA